MKNAFSTIIIVLLSCCWSYDQSSAQQIASIEIGSDYTIEFNKFPIVLESSEEGAYFDWKITGIKVKDSTEELNKLTIHDAENGEGQVSLNVVVVDFENQKTYVKHSKIKFRIDIRGPSKDPDKPTDPVEPPTGDFSELSLLAETLSKKLEDPVTAKALAGAYRSAFDEISDEMPYKDAVALATGKSGDAFQDLDQLTVDWNPFIKSINKKMNELGATKSTKSFRLALKAIAEGLEKSQ